MMSQTLNALEERKWMINTHRLLRSRRCSQYNERVLSCTDVQSAAGLWHHRPHWCNWAIGGPTQTGVISWHLHCSWRCFWKTDEQCGSYFLAITEAPDVRGLLYFVFTVMQSIIKFVFPLSICEIESTQHWNGSMHLTYSTSPDIEGLYSCTQDNSTPIGN